MNTEQAKIRAEAKKHCEADPTVTIYNWNTSFNAYIAGRTEGVKEKLDNRIKDLNNFLDFCADRVDLTWAAEFKLWIPDFIASKASKPCDHDKESPRQGVQYCEVCDKYFYD